MSWPSAKQSASTWTTSPAMRFTANRPPSTAGAMPSMTARLDRRAGSIGCGSYRLSCQRGAGLKKKARAVARVNDSEWNRPCADAGAASTPPRFPTPLPP